MSANYNLSVFQPFITHDGKFSGLIVIVIVKLKSFTFGLTLFSVFLLNLNICYVKPDCIQLIWNVRKSGNFEKGNQWKTFQNNVCSTELLKKCVYFFFRLYAACVDFTEFDKSSWSGHNNHKSNFNCYFHRSNDSRSFNTKTS